MTKNKGLVIAIYGINNIGKTTQVNLLKDELEKSGKKTIIIKYPVYDLETTGPKINSYLRQGNPEKISAKEIQYFYAQNRKDFEPKLKEIIKENNFIILEDYTGTGISWGLGTGVLKEYLIDINKDLLKEDIAILMDGKRFLQAEEKNHKHENDFNLVDSVREKHLELAKEFNWNIVDANRSIIEVHKDILNIVLNYENQN